MAPGEPMRGGSLAAPRSGGRAVIDNLRDAVVTPDGASVGPVAGG